MKKFKITTFFGTRPEIIRLSEIIKKLDLYFNHILVNSNQNFDSSLNSIFLKNFNLRKPDYNFNNDLHGINFISEFLKFSKTILKKEKPDAIIVLGDTNTCLCTYVAKQMNIKIFHIEAGNRSFDSRVPEEINRKLIDHLADINIAYSEFAKHNLLNENIHVNNVLKLGSPLHEVLISNKTKISKSKILNKYKLKKNKFYLCSIHRHENISDPDIRKNILEFFDYLDTLEYKTLISFHPKTKEFINLKEKKYKKLIFCKPFDYFDYIKLQANSKCVLSDSGSITEESSILKFNAISLRKSHERQEGFRAGLTPVTLFNVNKINF
jgi:UDP-N-acetylglucosamine 2-epimerase